MNRSIEFSTLVGKILTRVELIDNDEIHFSTEDADYRLFHERDCCEHVYVEDVCGDLKDLVGYPILIAEESTSDVDPEGVTPEDPKYRESFQWTFYRLSTIKGSVAIRFYGSSDYYSVSVSFAELS